MTLKRPDFLIAYNHVPVPETMLSMDANNEQVHASADQFFEDIMNSLDLGRRTLGDFFEINYRMLIPTIKRRRALRETDEYTQFLQKTGSQTLAAVLYRRDDFNYQIAHFAKFPLLPKTVAEIRELQQFDRFEDNIE